MTEYALKIAKELDESLNKTIAILSQSDHPCVKAFKETVYLYKMRTSLIISELSAQKENNVQ